MITGSEMAIVDANAAALGVPRKQLMESSGNAVAGELDSLAEPGDRILIVAGRGNNGGDAFVTARFLDDYDPEVVLLGRPGDIRTPIARENWDALEAGEYTLREVRDSTAVEKTVEPLIDSADVVVDAMLGTGISGELREPEATVASAINDADDITVVSVDVPSGLDTESGEVADNAVEADTVVTFHDEKPGLGDLDSSVTVADIGIPAAAEAFVEHGDLLRLSRDPGSHKGENGEILVIGGGPYTGAPALAAQAALRAGADLVKVTCPTSVAHEVQGYSPNLILYPMQGTEFEPGHVGQVMEYAARHDVVVIGPGLGDQQHTLEAAEAIIESLTGTAVVDADALQVVPDLSTEADLICTPHAGEFVDMGGSIGEDWRERRDRVERFAADLDQTILVKGQYDVISDGNRTRVNRTGNPGMTVGGTGDVLAGVTGALAALHPPEHAAALGAYITGRAGDLVADEYGNGLLASDLLDRIPEAMRYEGRED